MAKLTQISFVWNADFSIGSGLRALREVAQGEHSCTLCEIAYHRIRQTSEWKTYKQALQCRLSDDDGELVIREPCRNQITTAAANLANGQFPCVIGHQANGDLQIILDRTVIDACHGEFAPFQQALDAALDRIEA